MNRSPLPATSGLFLAFFCGLASQTSAAEIDVVPRLAETGFLYSLYLDPGTDAGSFDTLDLAVQPQDSLFLNYNPTGTEGPVFFYSHILFEDAEQTFTFALLSGAQHLEIPGFIVFDGGSQLAPSRISGPTGIFRSIASLGSNRLSNERRFLANVLLPPNTTWTIDALFLDNGVEIDRFHQALTTVPEPSTALLTLFAFLIAWFYRKRSRR